MENASLVFSRRMLRPRRRRATTVTIPERCYPHVKLVFAEMQRQNLRYEDVVEGSGVQRAALKAWRHKNKPGLDSMEAVLGFLGWDFVPIPRARAPRRPGRRPGAYRGGSRVEHGRNN